MTAVAFGPKIFSRSRIQRFKERKSENIENRPTEAKKRIFFLFGPKNPFGYLFSEMTSKGSISFSFLPNLQNLKIRPQGLQRRP